MDFQEVRMPGGEGGATSPPEGALFRHVGTTLVLVRELLGQMRQAECARRAGVPRSQLSRYETEAAVPTLETLGKVLGGLGVGSSEFFTVMAAVDLLAGGEESLESIRSKILERQQSILDEFLAGIARLNRRGWPGGGESSERAPDETREVADISSCCADLLRTGGADPEAAKRWARMLVTLADRIPKCIKRNDLLVET